VLWIKSIQGINSEFATSVNFDVFGNLVVVGFFYESPISFDSIILQHSSIDCDIFLAKLDLTTNPTELQPSETFTISPNPFTSQAIITFSKEQKNTTIKIIDVLGKEIKEITFNGKQFILEKGEMREGLYFVQIQSKDFSQTKKVIVAN
jgi:hypothetical protein